MTTRNEISRRESLKLMFGMLFAPLLRWLPKEKKREKFDFEKEIQGRVTTVVGPLEWPDELYFVPCPSEAQLVSQTIDSYKTHAIYTYEFFVPNLQVTKEQIISTIGQLPVGLQIALKEAIESERVSL